MTNEKNFERRFLYLQGHISNSAFGKKCGISEATVRYCRKGQIPSQKLLEKIASGNNVTVGWLLGITEDGGPQPNHVTMTQRIGKVTGQVHTFHGDFHGDINQQIGNRAAPYEPPPSGNIPAGTITGAVNKERQSLLADLHAVPVLGKISEDISHNLRENIESYVTFPDAPPDSFAIKVTNDAMAPGILHGDFVLFVINRQAAVGDIVVVNDEYGESMIRRLREKSGESFLVSDNPTYPTYPLNENYRVMGVVVDGFRRLKF